MQKEQYSRGVVYAVDAETMKAFNISSARVRMDARRDAQSEAWEACLRTAGGYVDFDLDDLVALEDRARAEFDRARAARAVVETREQREDREEKAVEYRENVRRHAGW